MDGPEEGDRSMVDEGFEQGQATAVLFSGGLDSAVLAADEATGVAARPSLLGIRIVLAK